jgi:hypothetical protein
MKTHVIQLDQHDDLTSVRDKMVWAKTPRILLVWPSRRSVDIRSLDMVLLQRHANSLGAQLGFATRSNAVRRSAIELGIPVFRSSTEAQYEMWGDQPHRHLRRRGKRRKNLRATLKRMRENVLAQDPEWLKNSYTRISVFTAGVLAVLVLFFLFLPSATIRLNPATQVQSVTIPIIIDPESIVVSIAGVIPAHLVSASVEGKGEAPATGKTTVPEARASGIVRFTNLTQSSVNIPEGTIIRTIELPAIRFFVSKSGEVQGGVGETLDLPVRSVEGGFEGNLPVDKLQAIEGSTGLSLAVTNPESTTGGGDVEKTIATSEDHIKLFEKVDETLSQQARVEITKQIPQGGYLLAGTLIGETVSEIYDPPDGLPAPRISLTLKRNFQAFYISDEDLKSLGNLVLDASVPKGYTPNSDTLSILPFGEPEIASDGRLTWQIRADRKIAAKINLLDVMSRVLGRKPETAKGNLAKLNVASSPEIVLSPAWWFWLPSLPLRITVDTKP